MDIIELRDKLKNQGTLNKDECNWLIEEVFRLETEITNFEYSLFAGWDYAGSEDLSSDNDEGC